MVQETANKMKDIKVEKITLNVGAGRNEKKLQRGVRLLKKITGVEPVKTYSDKRIPAWNIRPGLPVGCKLTLRGDEAVELLDRLLEANDKKLSENQFDEQGNFSFGVEEYINIPGVEYDQDIKIMGFEVAVTLERPGYRVKKRKVDQSEVGGSHNITPDEAKEFLMEEFNVEVGDVQ